MSERRLLTALAACAAAWNAYAGVEYENPVIRTDFPDPTVWTDGCGTNYAASTHQDVYWSTDLLDWRKTGRRLLEQAEYDWIARSWPHVWAPDVVRIGDWYNLYVCYHNSGEHTEVVGYRSRNPAGPFTDRAMLVSSEGDGRFEVIDPEVVRDPDTGRVWLFFGHGDVRRVELTDDGRRRKEGAPIVHVAGRALGTTPPDDALQGIAACEGAYLHRRQGKWYLFCSVGNWHNHTYRVIVGRADALTDSFYDREGRPLADGYGTVVLHSDEGDAFFGPGHNGEIFESPSGRTYLYYHCHVRGVERTDDDDSNMSTGRKYVPRLLFLQEVLWDAEGWPYFENGGKPQRRCEFR